jgi:hypothetical protein
MKFEEGVEIFGLIVDLIGVLIGVFLGVLIGVFVVFDGDEVTAVAIVVVFGFNFKILFGVEEVVDLVDFDFDLGVEVNVDVAAGDFIDLFEVVFVFVTARSVFNIGFSSLFGTVAAAGISN